MRGVGGIGGGCEYSGICFLHFKASISSSLGRYGNSTISVCRVTLLFEFKMYAYSSLCIV